MKRIESFCVNHDKLKKGMYVSRIDGDCITYDIRMAVPNSGVYLENDGIHTFEHLFATYVRNSPFSDGIIYVGPMGCRTGFYFLTQGMRHEDAIELTRQALRFIAEYEGEIPGATAAECGNYLEQDLPGVRAAAARMLPVLAHWQAGDLQYTKGE